MVHLPLLLMLLNNTHIHMPKEKDQQTIQDLMGKLEKTIAWFQSREEVDVEEGLKRVKEGAELIKNLQIKLKKVENEFEEIKKDLAVDGE